MQISFIGGGNMARAIISGLKNNHFKMNDILVVEPDVEKRTLLNSELGVQVTDDIDEIRNSDVIVLAVKPQQLKDVCLKINSAVNKQLVISIAAGIKSTHIASWLPKAAVVRVMPNTPAQIQAGVSALYAMPSVSIMQREQATTILSAVGATLWLDDEAKMDAVTAISGSGPAYVFYLIEALQEAALALGLTHDEAKLLALQTFAGASLLAAQSADDVRTLRSQVTSKGGTTEQGILALEQADIKSIMKRAAKAAADKSVLLGELLGQ